MAGNEHFMFSEETTYGTWAAPTKALPVISATVAPEAPLLIDEATGGGRGRRDGDPGAIAVSGDVETYLYPVQVGWLLRSVFATRAVTGTGPYTNKFLIDDDVAHDSFSLQKRYSASTAESVRGAKINRIQITARTREFAMLSLGFVGKDATINGSVWSDGTSAPSVLSPTYPASIPEAFKFYQGQIIFGGTVAEVSGELQVTGGTAEVDFDNIELEMNFNIGTDAYGVNLGDRTIQTADEGRRELMVRFDPNFDTNPSAYYTAWKAGTPAVIQLHFEQGTDEMTIVLPNVKYETGALPELNADYGLKRYTVEGVPLLDQTLDRDVGMVIISDEDLVT
jgi:hypothetical protein